MAALEELIKMIEDDTVRLAIEAEVKKLKSQKKFGLVFENHDEYTPLYEIPIKIGSLVALKKGEIKNLFRVIEINGDKAKCFNQNDTIKGFYPDFLIVRDVPETGYVIDILEPHRGDLTDNLSKAKAFMRYMERQPSAQIGRIQLIRAGKDSLTGHKKMKRLDFSRSYVRDEVKKIFSTTELDNLFLNDNLII